MKDFLLSKGIIQTEVEKLFDAEFIGRQFVEWSKTDYFELELIGKATVVQICKVRQGLEKVQGNNEVQLRPFNSPVTEDVFYAEGSCLPHEVGGSGTREPAREYKRFNFDNMRDDKKLKQRFISKAERFIIGCMNARCNGTIYFGVGDQKKSSEGLQHGEVVGNEIDSNRKDSLEDAMKVMLTGRNACHLKGAPPDVKEAISACVSPLRFVPVKSKDQQGTGKNRYIIEIDVEPKTDICKEEKFFIVHENEERKYYLREGSDTNVYQSSNLEEFKRKVNDSISKRESHEEDDKTGNLSIEKRLETLIIRNISNKKINDDHFRYILVTDIEDISDVMFSWISAISWSLCIDLKHSGEKSIHKHLRENKHQLEDSPCIEAKKLTELYQKKPAEALEMSGVKSGGLVITTNKEESNKMQAEFAGISDLISQYLQHSKFDRLERVIVLFLLEKESTIDETGILIDDFAKRLPNSSQFVFLSSDQNILTNLFALKRSFLGKNALREIMQTVSWGEVKTFMEKALPEETQRGNTNMVELVSSFGTCHVENKVINLFEKANIQIVSRNHFELEVSKEEFWKDAEKLQREFLRGGSLDWKVFLAAERGVHKKDFVSGLVKRDLTDDIVSKYVDKIAKTDQKNCVIRKEIMHQPGSGATTIGKSILWKKRKEMRCIYMNGESLMDDSVPNNERLINTAHRILNIRALGEKSDIVKNESGDTRCPTVLMVLDNANNLLAEYFTRKIEDVVEQRQIKFRNPMIIMLYIVSSVEVDPDPRQFKVTQKLSDKEKERFSQVLESLESNGFNPEDMLSFVIMAENFNDDSKYVEEVVKKSMNDMDKLFPLQQELLLSLSLLKIYANKGLPTKTCLRFAEIDFNGKYGYKALSAHARLFLREYNQCDDKHIYGNCRMLEISHGPVAFQIKKFLGKSLDEVIKSILKSVVIMEEPFMKDYVHSTLRTILVQRIKGDLDEEKDAFSKLIMDINEQFNRERSKELLKTGFERLNEANRPFIAQAIARLIYKTKDATDEMLTEAKTWIDKAIEIRSNISALYDTKGHIFKTELKSFFKTQKEKRNSSLTLQDCKKPVFIAMKAAENFRKANRLFNETKSKNIQGEDQRVFSRENMELFTNNPGLLGEIISNLQLIEILKLSNELQKREKWTYFLKFLTEGEENEVCNLLQQSQFEQHEILFISKLYFRTKECFSIQTKKIAYCNFSTDNSLESMLTKMNWEMDKFNNLFGPDQKWRKIVDSENHSPPEKIAALRKHCAIKFLNNFGALLRSSFKPQDNLSDLQNVLIKLRELLDCDSVMDSMIAQDKLSYMNVAFYLIYESKDNKILSFEKVKEYCSQLVENKVDHPEPYLFYLVINWPTDESSNCDVDMINCCIKKLRELEEKYRDPVFIRFQKVYGLMYQKSYPLFYLAREKAVEQSFGKVFSAKMVRSGQSNNALFKQSGVLNVNKDVDIRCQNDKVVTVRAANYHHRGTLAKKVTFTIGFTFAGPKAYYIEEDHSEEMKKLQ